MRQDSNGEDKKTAIQVNIIQVYAPTQDDSDEEVEVFYEKIENVIQ